MPIVHVESQDDESVLIVTICSKKGQPLTLGEVKEGMLLAVDIVMEAAQDEEDDDEQNQRN